MSSVELIRLTPENVLGHRLFCVTDPKNPAFVNKQYWFNEHYKEGLEIRMLKRDNKPIAFIEYLPADYAWRPVNAPDYMCIHCMFVYLNKDKRKGYGSQLLMICEEDAKKQKMHGVTIMTSKKSWTPDKRLYEKNGYIQVDKKGRFELMVKKFDKNASDPELIDWTKNLVKYQGWHLL